MKIEDFKQGTNIDKITLGEVVYQKLRTKGFNIKIEHINSVITILFEEMAKLLLHGKTIIIGGFGKLFLQKMPQRHFFNFKTRKVEQSFGNKLLKFKLYENLRLKLLNNLDVQKTFNEEAENEKTK